MTSQWAWWRLKSPASLFTLRLFRRLFRGVHRSPMNSPHKGPVTRKMFTFDDVIMKSRNHRVYEHCVWDPFGGRSCGLLCLPALSVIGVSYKRQPNPWPQGMGLPHLDYVKSWQHMVHIFHRYSQVVYKKRIFNTPCAAYHRQPQ